MVVEEYLYNDSYGFSVNTSFMSIASKSIAIVRHNNFRNKCKFADSSFFTCIQVCETQREIIVQDKIFNFYNTTQ